MNRVKLGAAGLAIALTALIVPATVQAQPLVVEGTVAPTAVVSYADLNLASPKGIATLNARVTRAADQLCMDEGIQPLQRMLAGRSCRADAIAGADGQVREAVAKFGQGEYAALASVAVSLR